MRILSTLSKRSPNKIFIGIVLGAFSGIIFAILIPILMSVLQSNDDLYVPLSNKPYHLYGLEISNGPFALLFCVACLTILVCRTISHVLLVRVAINAASELRINLYCRIVKAPVAILERVGNARIINAIKGDIPRIIRGATMLPEVLVSTTTIVGISFFLYYMNAAMFFFISKCIFFGGLTYAVPLFVGSRYSIRTGKFEDALQASIDGVIHGVKELKLDDVKRNDYFKRYLLDNEYSLIHLEKTGNSILKFGNVYGDMIVFFIMGVIAFIFVNYHAINNQDLIASIFILLYMMGPITTVINFVPDLTSAQIAFERVNKLLAELPDENFDMPKSAIKWESLQFQHICYQHFATDETPGFKIGPLNLTFQRGEITFIVGGNGSGKSTLGKLISLHYPSSSGQIFFGDCCITNETIATYRQEISAIYSDYYLFDSLLGESADKNEVDYYLRLLKLDNKVSYSDGKFSTLHLSDGQRRRMALLVAFIENKELYLFDEWAADQDPSFKEKFYLEILPALRSRNKVVIVIAHDDRYFHVADKIIMMAEGVVTDVKNKVVTEIDEMPMTY